MKAKEKKVDENIYRGAIQQASCAFACHEAVFDESGNMTDYVFLDVNRAFEEFTGLEMDKVIGRRFVQDIARDREHAMKWVGISCIEKSVRNPFSRHDLRKEDTGDN